MRNKTTVLLFIFIAVTSSARVQALPASVRLDRAAEFSRAAAGASSLEQARDLSFNALDAAPAFGASAVDASGAYKKEAPAISAAPLARPSVAPVPSPEGSGSSERRAKNGGGFIIAGLLSPLVGAAAGALLGGGVGAVAGALIGTGVGLVLLLIGVARALRHIFNP